MRKILVTAFLSMAGLLFVGTQARTQPIPAQSQSGQKAQATKSIAGTIKSIGNDGHSFVLEVDQGGNKQTLNFTMDKDAQVKGNVTLGTPVTVEYVAMGDQNMAKTVTAQG